MRTVLVDGDLLLYRFGFRGERTVTWEDGVVSKWAVESAAISDLAAFIAGIQSKTHSNQVVVCLSGERCFRYNILSSYKHNRKNHAKPELYQKLKDYIKAHYTCKEYPHLEADDCLGILATYNMQADTIIASIDKDLQQIPGKHFNWNKDSNFRVITTKEADFFFYLQILVGDSTDGYTGCPKIGAHKAKLILNEIPPGIDWERRAWEAILKAYAAKSLDESFALTQARMARILRASDYDFSTGEVKLWAPQLRD
jgi:DNA polymerase-1